MNTQSQTYPLDEFPVLIRPGVSIGMITDGIADLAIAWDDEQGRAYIERVESISLRTDDTTKKDAPHGSECLSEHHPLFALIADEIERRADAGDIELKFDREPDPDYLRDLHADRGLYVKPGRRAA
ncbi:hypothetical protein [Pseudochelatococcus contaminans]|uniref:Uncharacterized protein n=1 Tax=Pseudochelatococcus contaminans TaxID=1538103 RepID=A0A7W6EFE3_9HYPH|nr:hypothetical protein [Pseudochelatococcus contaminans]MBB3808788.1 hypothetical protein [Pseudochelatococcus contaminans]